MIKKTKDYIIKNKMIKPCDKVAAAVSGGADSVCMLLLLNELKKQLQFELKAIHVEHGIRGEESKKDARFVEGLCKSLGIECIVCPVDVIGFSKKQGLGLEEAARILRYDAFEKNAKDCLVAVAHHQEDNAETVIFQLLRGSGPRGMSGILPISKKGQMTYIRPLLFSSRKDIEEELLKRKQEYVTDSTNTDVVYSRNKLRHDVFPMFTQINSRAVEHINFAASQQMLLMDYIFEQVKEEIKNVATYSKKNVVQIDIGVFQKIHPALQGEIILELLGQISGKKKDIGNVHVESVLSLMKLQSGRSMDLPYSVVAKKTYDKLILCKKKDETENDLDNAFEINLLKDSIPKNETVYIDLNGFGKISLRRFEFTGQMSEIPKKSYTKWLDYGKINCNFSIRKRRAGDYIVIDGAGHRKKLKQYFIDAKIPIEERENMWLIASESEVLCVMGGRAGNTALVSNDTKEVLEVQLMEK